MKTVTNKEFYNVEREVHGATAMSIAEIEEEQFTKDREGKMKYLFGNKIGFSGTLRLDGEESKYENNKKFKALVESIKVEGILVPLVVRKNEKNEHDGSYVLIDGERRLRAANILGIKKVPVIVYEEDTDKGELLRVITNTNQKQVTPIELGMAYKRLLESGTYTSNRELATALGVSESTVGTRLNNLKMDKRIIDSLIENNSISDQKILKAIRTIEKVNDEGKSEKQWTIYSHIKSESLGRKDALSYIKEEKGAVVSERFVKLESDHKINVVIDTSGLDAESVSKIEALLSEIEELRQGTEA